MDKIVPKWKRKMWLRRLRKFDRIFRKIHGLDQSRKPKKEEGTDGS